MGAKQSDISVEVTLELLKRLSGLANRLNQWEMDFCYDMTHHLDCGGKPSLKQYVKLKSLQVKYFGS